MKTKLYGALLTLATITVHATEATSFNTSWIQAEPEVLTYRSKAGQGDGLYQVSTWRTDGGIELYMNIITTGFTKSVWGSMGSDMRPHQSTSRITVQNQVTMKTDVSYKPSELHVATLMGPGNHVMENTLSLTNLVLDFSQAPLVARTLPLKPGAEFTFASLNPQNNSLVPLTLRVIGEETIAKTESYKVEANDFEGRSIYWIEKAGHHRVLRIEQPGTGRVTELIQ